MIYQFISFKKPRKWFSFQKHTDKQRHLCFFGVFKELPGCLFTRTFLLKSSYTLLHMLECLKLHASPL